MNIPNILTLARIAFIPLLVVLFYLPFSWSMPVAAGLFGLAYDTLVLTLPALVIIGREIVISALREWMAEMGKRGMVAVSWIGKLKTTLQMVSLLILLALPPTHEFTLLGVVVLYTAAILTLWSMIQYLKAAWPHLSRSM